MLFRSTGGQNEASPAQLYMACWLAQMGGEHHDVGVIGRLLDAGDRPREDVFLAMHSVRTDHGDGIDSVGTLGGNNTAAGMSALSSNTEGWNNTASGVGTLQLNTTGGGNTASGWNAPDLAPWLVEHRLARRLQCHHCGYSQNLPKLCPECGADIADDMERLTPLSGVHEFPSRVKCATLAWHALDAALRSFLAGRMARMK